MELCTLILLLAGGVGQTGRGELARQLADIRGANYTPSYASTSVGSWLYYDPAVVDRELGYAEKLRLNSVRVFLSVVACEADPDAFRRNLHDFVARCDRHAVRPLFVMFDSCFGEEPSLDKARSPTWLNNPGFHRLAESDGSSLEAYVRCVVEPLRGDRRILGWDVMNEPMADFQHVTRGEREIIWRFVRHQCAFIKQLDPDHPITVGHAVVEYIPRTIEQVDFASIHSYAPYADWFRADIDLASKYAAAQGKPVVVTECGNPGSGQPYPMVFQVAGEAGTGFYFWELMIGNVMFRDSAGLIYPDGTTRDPPGVSALLGFSHNRDGVPLKTPPDPGPLRKLIEQREKWPELIRLAEEAPRTRDGITPLLVPLGTVAREAARPSADAAEIFELCLSIGHMFRLENPAEAVASYERLLQLARKSMMTRQEPDPKDPT